jgi:hypothetical protein
MAVNVDETPVRPGGIGNPSGHVWLRSGSDHDDVAGLAHFADMPSPETPPPPGRVGHHTPHRPGTRLRPGGIPPGAYGGEVVVEVLVQRQDDLGAIRKPCVGHRTSNDNELIVLATRTGPERTALPPGVRPEPATGRGGAGVDRPRRSE